MERSRHLTKYDFEKKQDTKCPEHFKKSKQTTLIYAGFKRLSKPCVYGLLDLVGSQVPVILSTNATVAMPRGFKRNNWNTKDIKGPCEHSFNIILINQNTNKQNKMRLSGHHILHERSAFPNVCYPTDLVLDDVVADTVLVVKDLLIGRSIKHSFDIILINQNTI